MAQYPVWQARSDCPKHLPGIIQRLLHWEPIQQKFLKSDSNLTSQNARHWYVKEYAEYLNKQAKTGTPYTVIPAAVIVFIQTAMFAVLPIAIQQALAALSQVVCCDFFENVPHHLLRSYPPPADYPDISTQAYPYPVRVVLYL